MVDDVGHFAVGALQPLTEVEERLLVGEVEREVVELRRARVGDARGLAERLASAKFVYSKNATVFCGPNSKK